MTENNAAQPGLTEAELDAIHASMQNYAACNINVFTFIARAIESALLSKLRAEGVRAGELPAYIIDDSHPLQYRLGWNNCLSDCRAALASTPVADESPMAKMADALREKARQEQQTYQDRRAQATEWGPLPEGTEADLLTRNAPVAHVAGDETSRYLDWAKDRSAWEMPVGTPVYYSALASAPVAGEAVAGYMVGTDYFRPDVLAAARIYAENRNMNVRTLHYADAAPQASALDTEYTRGRADGFHAGHSAALEKAAAALEDHRRAGREWVPGSLWDTLSREGAARIRALKQPQADKDGGQQREGIVTDEMRYAVRFAPSSAHWSERLREFFGPDAREGIDALEKQLREARGMLDRQQRAAFDHPVFAFLLGEGQLHGVDFGERAPGAVGKWWWRKDLRAALSAPQAEQGERDEG